MAVTVKIPSQLKAEAQGQTSITAEGGTVGAVLDSLFEQHPSLKDRLSDESGGLRRFVNVYVDGEDIRFGDGLDTEVPAGAEVQVLPAVAGGR